MIARAGSILVLVSIASIAAMQADERPRPTLEEKALIVTGRNSCQTQAVERLGLPSAWLADGPAGLRKATGRDLSDSVPATCFPSAAALAATWDPELVERAAAAIGDEARHHRVALLLAPGLNVKRHPLGGRNFEYYSEDPLLGGRIAAAFVRGVQSRGVGATLKHFAVNNQEHRRMTIDARVDERALREIYLRGFEIAVREGRPWAVMSAYNRVNGSPASENPHLLNGILRGEWGFDGLVVSDWGAVDDPAAAIAAGLDLEMPGNPLSPRRIVRAVREGRLDEADLDRAAGRVMRLVERYLADDRPRLDRSAPHHRLAREIAAGSMVLLENDGTLPIGPGLRRVGVTGALAFDARIQGVGSSQVNPTRVDVPWRELLSLGEGRGHEVMAYEEGTAAELEWFLAQQDVVVIFAGQPASHDAEAWDRPSAGLAPDDLALIEATRRSGKPFVVVLVGGGAIDVRPLHGAAAVLMTWLGGQAFGSAVAEVLFGVRSPSGRLAETFALAVDDHPSALNFPGGPRAVRYGEGLWVGYRYFQSFDREVAYPFGHGLSYTSFEYRNVEAPRTLKRHDEGFEVRLQVANVGSRSGAEVVQLYLRHHDPALVRPDRELIAFAKVALDPGQATELSLRVDPERLAYFHDGHGRWVVEPGRYELLVGASVADIRATLPLDVAAGTMPDPLFALDDTMGDLYEDARGRVLVDRLLAERLPAPLSELPPDDFLAAVIRNLPVRKLTNFSEGALTVEALEAMLRILNDSASPDDFAAALAASGY